MRDYLFNQNLTFMSLFSSFLFFELEIGKIKNVLLRFPESKHYYVNEREFENGNNQVN